MPIDRFSVLSCPDRDTARLLTLFLTGSFSLKIVCRLSVIITKFPYRHRKRIIVNDTIFFLKLQSAFW